MVWTLFGQFLTKLSYTRCARVYANNQKFVPCKTRQRPNTPALYRNVVRAALKDSVHTRDADVLVTLSKRHVTSHQPLCQKDRVNKTLI